MKEIIFLLKLTSLVATLAILSSCGSGGNSQPASETLQTIQTSIAIDSSVPDPAKSVITKVASPVNDAQSVSIIEIPDPSLFGESLVLALDANDNMILASFSSSDVTTLNAQTTALALARFALGPLGSITPAQANQVILTSAEYSNLISAINLALSTGVSPIESDGVMQSVITVSVQAGQALMATALAKAATTKSLANPTVDSTQLPYIIFPTGTYSGNGIAIKIVGASASGVNVENGMQITFASQSTDMAGNPIPSSQGAAAIDGTILLPGVPLYSQPQTVSVPGNGDAFNITVSQTNITKATNVKAIVADTLNVALGLIPGGSECVKSTVDVLASNNLFDTAIAQASEVSIGNYFDSISSMDIAQAWLACVQPTHAKPTQIARLAIKFLGKLVLKTAIGVYTAGETVMKASHVALEVAQLGKYWGSSRTVGVCMNGSVLVNCTASLQISPASPQVTVGQHLSLGVTAKDNSGNTTATPNGLIWTSSDETVATIDSSGLLTGLAAGITNITVTDTASGVISSAETVTVGLPTLTITPQNPSIGIGTTVRLNLSSTDFQGAQITIIPNPQWTSSNPAIASVDSTGLVAGVTSGSTTITVTDPTTLASGTTTVTVFCGLMGMSTGSVITYYFSGALNDPFGSLAVGTPFTGSFSYAASQVNLAPIGVTEAAYNSQSVSLNVGGETLTVNEPGNIAIYDSTTFPVDLFHLYAQNVNGSLGGLTIMPATGIIITLQDLSGTAWSNTTLPGAGLTMSNLTAGAATHIQLQSQYPADPLSMNVIARGSLSSCP